MALTSTLITQIKSDLQTDLEALFTHGAVGNDATTATASDTALGSEDFRDDIDEFDTSSADSITASLRVLTTENNGNDVKEVGWFDAAAAGNMMTRNTLTTISKTNSIQLFLDTKITFVITEVT